MIKKAIEDELPAAVLKGIPTDNAVARKCIGLTDASKIVNIQNFRLACMHTTPQDTVSVIGASRWPQTSFDWYDSASAKVTFPTTEVAFSKNYDYNTPVGYETFYPSNPTGDNFYWDRRRLWELASQVLPKVRTADGIPDDAEIVEPGTPGETVYGFGGQANYTQAHNTMAFHRPIIDVFYSANDCKSEHAITAYWTEAQIMGNGNGGITVTPYYNTGRSAGSDYGVAGNKLILEHTSNVKMGIECIFSAEGLDDYLSASRNTQTYHGVDGIFNIVTKGFLNTPPTDGASESVGVTKFYDMKTECKRIAPNTYYLNDDDYYRITHSKDDYNGNSAYIHCTMFANGFPQFHLASRNWVIVYKRKSYPNPDYLLSGVSAQVTPGDKTKDVWQGAFGFYNPGDNEWYYPYCFSTRAAAQSFINEHLTGYSADFSLGDYIEPRYTYSRRSDEKFTTLDVATADFPNYGQIIALNYHFTAL